MNRKNVSNYHRLNFTVGFSAQVICATYISNKQYSSSRSHKRKVSPRKLKRESLIFFHLSIENLVLCSLFFFESVKISSWNYFNWLCCWRRSSPSTSSSQFFFSLMSLFCCWRVSYLLLLFSWLFLFFFLFVSMIIFSATATNRFLLNRDSKFVFFNFFQFFFLYRFTRI